MMTHFKPTHRHYKGGLYQELHRATHSETLEPLVIYRDSKGRIWARPAAMFDGLLEDGTIRFERIER